MIDEFIFLSHSTILFNNRQLAQATLFKSFLIKNIIVNNFLAHAHAEMKLILQSRGF